MAGNAAGSMLMATQWKTRLSEFVHAAEPPDPQPASLGVAASGHGRSSDPPIPRFFVKKATKESELAQNLDRATYSFFVQVQRQSLPTNDELDLLWDYLLEKTAEGAEDEERRINYAQFVDIQNKLPRKFDVFFAPSIFLQLLQSPDLGDTIAIVQFYNYILRIVSLLQARIDLGMYDLDCDTCLTEEDIQAYIADLMPQLNLSSLSTSFHKFYLCTASRKFSFFLDPMRRAKIKIQTILLSPILTELFELREPELPKDFERTNWFSTYSSLRVYGQFLNLDTDQNGMLSRKELGQYNGGTLTSVFLDRVFQECQTYGGEMDYRGFLDFVLAMENIQTPESMAYFFRALDIRGVGYLDGPTVMYFFKDVLDKMVAMGHEPIGIRDVKNEIFDMANPRTESRITLDDLVASGVGGTIIRVLSDVEGFWAYEARESFEPQK
ncbi:Serine/threonine-protein phosphatase 2A regulatory subunit B'' subunit gamma [Geranomyces variabilis]|nr:Serine/threonine-protein phosphatase 2A regulatory subunit B'' subunit gamma [Geranomyces variabilis]